MTQQENNPVFTSEQAIQVSLRIDELKKQGLKFEQAREQANKECAALFNAPTKSQLLPPEPFQDTMEQAINTFIDVDLPSFIEEAKN